MRQLHTHQAARERPGLWKREVSQLAFINYEARPVCYWPCSSFCEHGVRFSTGHPSRHQSSIPQMLAFPKGGSIAKSSKIGIVQTLTQRYLLVLNADGPAVVEYWRTTGIIGWREGSYRRHVNQNGRRLGRRCFAFWSKIKPSFKKKYFILDFNSASTFDGRRAVFSFKNTWILERT